MRPTPRTEAIGTAKLVSPMRTNTACVTASVCGRRNDEVGALARLGVDVERAAELADFAGDHVHADAAAGQAADFVGGGEARLEDQHVQVACRPARASAADQAALDRALVDRPAVEAGAVVADFQHDFRTFAAHRDADRAFLGLVRPCAARSGDSRPCATALRSMCSSGAVMRSSTLRSSSPCAPSSLSWTCLPVSLAAWRSTRRRRGTSASNGTMRVRMRPSCSSELTRDCCSSSVSYWRVRSSSDALQRRSGRPRTRRGARELLQRREAVELERIERLVGRFVLALVARDDLRFGFDVQACAAGRAGAGWSAPFRPWRRGTHRAAVPGARGRSRLRRRS